MPRLLLCLILLASPTGRRLLQATGQQQVCSNQPNEEPAPDWADFWEDTSDQLEHNGCRPDPNLPDTKRNVTQLIDSRGFQHENYELVTGDGYILDIQRVVNPLVREDQRPLLKPVLLQHGLMSSSIDWVINSDPSVRPQPFDFSSMKATLRESQDRPNSLAFYLANRGFDVWLANSRGNRYGQRHVNLTASDRPFWAFTFDQQIAFDLPDTIALIQRNMWSSNNATQKLAYVGYSQGALMMLGLMSLRPHYQQLVEPFVALAPVAYVANALTPARHFQFLTPLAQHINAPLATNRYMINYLASQTCGRSRILRRQVCANFLFVLTGFNEDELDDDRLEAYLCHLPSGTSLKNLAHYGQGIRSGRFAAFDYGPLNNQLRYGQSQPPDYPLQNIRSRSLVIFSAENDWLASPKDLKRLRESLPVRPHKWVNMTQIKPRWNHADFLYARSTGETINPRVHEALEEFRNKH